MKVFRVFNVVLAGLMLVGLLVHWFSGGSLLTTDGIMLMNAVVFFCIGLENLLDRDAERKVGYVFIPLSLFMFISTL
ncbi:hypothetical protein [Halobacillus salinus]|uniref:Uncharacterized protein n=1 Tax=Halobacillus salinus TaxID=192814 RepID=A0A4Z0H0W7_9BACI|nr:hypothetical protein [Halobacillus salinus]TGB03750.1 hypothetical protein E4663_01730 [Halobacillus salinus]